MVMNVMKRCAHIERESATEVLTARHHVTGKFHPDLRWPDVAGVSGIACGGVYDGWNVVVEAMTTGGMSYKT
jgi:hypothetical protein